MRNFRRRILGGLAFVFCALAYAETPGTLVLAASGPNAGSTRDGVIQALRQTTVAAQVSGAVVGIEVKAGDSVRAGQTLLRLDARAAEQTAAAALAQVAAARASLDAASREFERQKQLFEQRFISRAALDRAEAEFKTAQAGAQAQLAAAGAARAQTDFYLVRAPYSGVVAEVPVVLGDMAMPGKPLVEIYDPAALRVSAAVPQSLAALIQSAAQTRVELPGTNLAPLVPQSIQLLPTVDPATHTQELRLMLPAGILGITPGMFARVTLASGSAHAPRLLIPSTALVKRAELTGVYALGLDGKPKLRQVRLGPAEGGQVEVLSGLKEGERFFADATKVKP